MRSRAFQFFTRVPPGEISLFFYFPCSAAPRAASLFYYYFRFVRKDIIVDYDFLINARLRLTQHRSLVQ